MQKTLANPIERAAVTIRLRQLTPDSTRRWGRMTSHQAICHLSDSFRSMMSPNPISSVSTPFSRTVVRWLALQAPIQWPHGVKTRPEVDQEIGGTTPVDFRIDRLALEVLIEDFSRRTHETMQAHPLFGPLSTGEWQRWGYLHLDHHLRQFGA